MTRAAIKSGRRFGSHRKRPICQDCGKVTYRAAETALRAAEQVSQRSAEEFVAYFDSLCGWYHIGHLAENGNLSNRITRKALETMKVK